MGSHRWLLVLSIPFPLLLAAQVFAADSFGDCKAPYEAGPDSFSPDGPLSKCSDEAFVDRMRQLHQLNDDDWDEGWGLDGSRSERTPFCALMEALSLLHDTRGNETVAGAGDFVAEEAENLFPGCDGSGANARAHGRGSLFFGDGLADPSTALYLSFFEQNTVARAATLVHEGGHFVTGNPHGFLGCPWGKDNSVFDKPCDGRYGDSGAWTLHVDYLRALIDAPKEIDGQRNTTVSVRHDARVKANEILQNAFEDDSGFRLRDQTSEFLADILAGDALLPLVLGSVEWSVRCGPGSCREEGMFAGEQDVASCFLTEVRGEFNDDGDGVRLRYGPRDFGEGTFDFYYMQAKSNEAPELNKSTAASGRCIERKPILFDYAVGGEDEFVELASTANDTVCYLTGVQGDLEFGSDLAEAVIKDGKWYAHVTGGILGFFGCTTGLRPPVLVEAKDGGNDGEGGFDDGRFGPPVQFFGTIDKLRNVCAVTKVSGDFAGDEEYVDVDQREDKWVLRVNDNRLKSTGTVHGGMACFTFR